MEDTFIMASDFQALPYYLTQKTDEEPEKGILYKDKALNGCRVVRLYSALATAPVGSALVSISRDDDHLYMNGVEYDVENS